MTQDMRLAILGTGHMAQSFAIAMESVDGVSLAGFCSRDFERARTFSTYFDAPGAYASVGEILADPAVDALYIANDSAAHASDAVAALDAGKAVLCEKPSGIDAGEVQSILDAHARTGALFMEAIPTPFLPAVAGVIEAGKNGTLGTPRRLTASFGYPVTPASHAACFAPVGGGVLLDRGIYLVTLALILMGPVRQVEAHVTRNADGVDVEAWLTLVHEDGATSALGASLTGELDNALTLTGTKGVAKVAAPLLAAENAVISAYGPPSRPLPARGGRMARLKRNPMMRRGLSLARAARTPLLPYGESLYCAEIEHFRDLFRAGASESPVLPPALSLAAMTILDQARSSAT